MYLGDSPSQSHYSMVFAKCPHIFTISEFMSAFVGILSQVAWPSRYRAAQHRAAKLVPVGFPSFRLADASGPTC